MRKYSIHVGCLYLELVGSYQEEIDTPLLHRACERYASAGSRRRQFATYDSGHGGTVCLLTTDKDNERRHTRPVRSRLSQLASVGTIVCRKDLIDEDKATGNRIRTVSNSFEATALWGLRMAARSSLTLPDDSFWGFDLAPAELERGKRYLQDKTIRDPGLDIVMTLNPKTICLPRYPVLGLNVKTSKRSDLASLIWYSPRINALALNLHLGRWPISDDSKDILHHRYKEAVKTDKGTQQLLTFMERNIEPIGSFLLQQVANGAYLAQSRMLGDHIGGNRHIRMLPEEGESHDRLFGQVSQLCSMFEASGIQPTWRHHYPPENVAQRQFLPTTPLQ